ncbi:unnamed protein product [Protopolystoma xenopodis]|uniref:NADH dehydrogenase [ubiquinone] iron-sulfur protein 4, mitochondrial n=1 Tax=Protopolystoma xenopodis TaxID=117903 RepID=A0A448X7N3_9PLAT|nr:unnamed protein product [Protopolystoma xenopodis]
MFAIKVMKKPDDFSNEERIIVPQETGTQIINAIPEEHKSGRLIRIYKQAKPATQSGSHGTRLWRIQFDCRERWENPLMGWSSTGDPLSNVSVEFATAEAAQHFCEKQGWPSYVDAPNKPILKVKSYGANFSWNKRTRVGSK